MRHVVGVCGTVLLLTGAHDAHAADAAAGKVKADQACGECHERADWEDEDVESMGLLIKNVVTGKTKHKGKVNLTDDEIASIAAYWAGGAK